MFRPAARDGLTATRLVLPHDAASVARFATAWEFLAARFPDDVGRLAEKVDAGEVWDGRGLAVTLTTPYAPRGFVYIFRDPAPEPEVPFDIPVLYRDDNLLVVDKPHFLATTPRGAYVTRSVVVRLRRELGLPELSPAHRLDRVTAGVLVCTLRPDVRGAYQSLFDRRAVTKMYEALAPVRPGLVLPTRVRSRIVKLRGEIRAREVPVDADHPVNAMTDVDLLSDESARSGPSAAGVLGRAAGSARSYADPLSAEPRGDGLGLYRLRPLTGKTHQLRLHMASLGVPIVGDNFYPDFYDMSPEDYSRPLRLLARSVEFTDPLSSRPRRFESARMV